MLVRPCVLSNAKYANVGVSCSRRRRDRMRWTAVRKSLLASSHLKEFLQGSPDQERSKPSLRGEAESFMPVDIDWDIFNFTLQAEDIIEVAPIPRRRLMDTCVAESLPVPPSVDPAACHVLHTAAGDTRGHLVSMKPYPVAAVSVLASSAQKFGMEAEICDRRVLPHTCKAEQLPSLVTPLVEKVNVHIPEVYGFTSVSSTSASAVSARQIRTFCMGEGHITQCSFCCVPDGRYGRHRRCDRECAEVDCVWGPTKCCKHCKSNSLTAMSEDTVERQVAQAKPPAWALKLIERMNSLGRMIDARSADV